MDKTQLVVKNIPNNFPNLQDYFKTNYGAVAVKSYGRRRVILRFRDANTAADHLRRLHQTEINGCVLSVEYLCRRKNESEDPEEDTEKLLPKKTLQISEFVKSLYATSTRFGFEQPPPPYLKYSYPKINRNILDSISIALLSNSQFYTQVLHLMNRMNLEPPFLPRTKPFIPPGDPQDVCTQTDFDIEDNLVGSDESELDTDDEGKIHLPAKRKKKADNVNFKKKARNILRSSLSVKSVPTQDDRLEDLNHVFERTQKSRIGTKISLDVASVKIPMNDSAAISEISTSEQDDNSVTITSSTEQTQKMISEEELKLNRIPGNQLADLPVYKNYMKGEPSCKLYIKNLNKTVTESDLRLIYERYCEGGSIEIKLMQYGRMKGQAFVTFNLRENNLNIVSKALAETNGYILKNKPMVVCFGKVS